MSSLQKQLFFQNQAIIYDKLVSEGLIVNLNLPSLSLSKYLFEKNFKQRKYWSEYFRKKSINRFLVRVPAFCHNCFGTDPLIVKNFLCDYIIFYENLCDNKGPIYAVKWFKSLNGITNRHLCNHKFDKTEYMKYKNGLPYILRSLSSLVNGSIRDRQCVSFLVQLYKLAEVPNTEDLSVDTITHTEEHDTTNHNKEGAYFHKAALESGLGKVEALRICNSFSLVLDEMFPKEKQASRLKQLQGMNKLHISTKNGPNGLSLLTAPIDWIAIRKDKRLYYSILELSRLLKNKSLNTILGCFRLMETNVTETSAVHSYLTSKLSTKVEPGGKMRVFAIGDWFSQSVLKGFHNFIFRKLYSYTNDGTKSHSELSLKIKEWTTTQFVNTQGIYSVDLTAATDLLSCLFQKEIVNRIMGRTFGKLWYTIMSQRSFHFRDLNLSDVRYEKGQPMGLYSSWGMLAMSHHVICRTALKLAGIQYDPEVIQFGIIGDDIALYGQEFYKYYMLLMNTLLKVPINKMKGFTPDTVSDSNPLGSIETNVAEIAKRIFINGEELTTVTPNSAKAGLERPEDFPSLLNELSNRSLLPYLSTPRCVQLAKLGFKPKIALELASFPALPSKPVLKGVGMAKLSEIPEEFSDIPWVKTTIDSQFLLIELCKVLRKKIIPTMRKSLNSVLEYNINRTSWSSRAYTYESKPFIYLLRLVNKELTNRLNLFEIGTSADTLTFNIADLRKSLDSVNVLSDLSLLLDDSSRDNKDTKGKTNTLIKKIVRSISVSVLDIYNSQYSLSDASLSILLNSIFIETVAPIEKLDSGLVVTRIDENFIDLSYSDTEDYGEWDITIE
jgi:hypothetical protein